MRQKIVAGNWKMNLRLEEAKQLVAGFMQVPIESECRVHTGSAVSISSRNFRVDEGSD